MMVAVGVRVRRFGVVDANRAVLVPAAEALLEDRAGQHVAQLGLDHSAGAGQLDVLHAHDGQQLPVHLEHGPVPKVVGRDHSCVAKTSSASSYPTNPRPVITPRAARAVTLLALNSSRA